MTATPADLQNKLLAMPLNPDLLGIGGPYLSQDLLKSPPLAPSRYLFLLPAVAHVGRVTQGDAWKDWETATLYCPAILKPTATVDSILKQHRPPQKPMPTTLSNIRSGGGSYKRDSEDYDLAMMRWGAGAIDRLRAAQATVKELNEAWERMERDREAHAPGVEALRAAFRALSVAIVERQVAPFARLRSGGSVFDIKPDTFASEWLFGRVIREGVLTEGGAQVFLFVDRAQLERAFPVALPDVEPSDFEGLHLSQSMKLALLTVRDWEVNPGNQPKVEALAEHVKSLAKVQGETLSDSRALAIARVLRDGFGG